MLETEGVHKSNLSDELTSPTVGMERCPEKTRQSCQSPLSRWPNAEVVLADVGHIGSRPTVALH